MPGHFPLFVYTSYVPDMRQKMAFFGVCLVALGTFEAHSFHIVRVFDVFQSSDKLMDLKVKQFF